MLSKLSLRNAKRSTKDYLIYIVTMTLISALMFSLHGMIFSSQIQALFNDFTAFAGLIGVASFFVMCIIIWLVHYMVNFMMERRSREFGTYLLLGMNRKQITRMFRRENLLLGGISTILGILPGMFFQVAFTNIFYSILKADARISVEFSFLNILLTCSVLFSAYCLALHRIKRRLRKLNIRDLMHMDTQNEQVVKEKRTWKKCLVPLSLIYIILFNILVLTSSLTLHSGILLSIGLLAAIYLLYIGLSAFFISYVEKKHGSIYQDTNVFVLRQLASKVKTMRFTMGTLSVMFTAALLCWTCVMMFADWQQKELEKNIPFDILIFSDQPDAAFAEHTNIINETAEVSDTHIYQVHTDYSSDMNEYLYAHAPGAWHGDAAADGTVYTSSYFEYDTYIALSDYNYIRSMLGYEPVSLASGSYLIHGKERLTEHLEDAASLISIRSHDQLLSYSGLYTEPLSQNGLNGADYLIVISDNDAAAMTPYYALFAVMLDETPPADLQDLLLDLEDYGYDEETFSIRYDLQYGNGSDTLITFSGTTIVRDIAVIENSSILLSACYMFAYIGIVFLCAALTILAVQQLSDSGKYKFRYSILRNLGLNKRETDRVVLKQLAVYYLCPFLIAVILSMFIGLFASERFVFYTGIQAGIFQYYMLSTAIFTLLYLIYFAVTYIGFTRTIHMK